MSSPGPPPLVSIVTPSFNQARFLRRTIDSVLRQDYAPIEYFVVDGGSRDGSLAILQSYGDRLRWSSEPDRGQTHAINKGLARARGAILAYLNSDDVLMPGAVTAMVRAFANEKTADVVYGDAFWVDEIDRFLGRYPTRAFAVERLLEGCFLCQPATFWRRRVLDQYGPLDESLHFAMDFEYWLRIARAGGRFHWLRQTLACSRLHPRTKTLSQRDGVIREVYDVSRRHLGQVGFANYLAYWQQCLRDAPRLDQPASWAGFLRRLPTAAWWLALLHSRWEGGGRRAWPFCRDGLRALGRRLRRLTAH